MDRSRRDFLRTFGLGAAGVLLLQDEPFHLYLTEGPRDFNSFGAQSLYASEPNLEDKISLQVSLEEKQGHLAKDEKLGIVVYDLTAGSLEASVKGEEQFQCASMVKPFVALAILNKVSEGKLVYDDMTRRHMELMIGKSNNHSTNCLMKSCGGPKQVNKYLKKEFPAVLPNISIVEYIPETGINKGRTYKNKATHMDYCRLLRELWNDRLPNSEELKRLLELPARDRLVLNVDGIPESTRILNKTGTTAHLCGDMGIILPQCPEGNTYPYIISASIEKVSRPRHEWRWRAEKTDVIKRISCVTYQHFRDKYQLS